MRKCFSILLLICALLGVGACDYVRSLAGRPTSADLEVMREKIHQDSLAAQARADSIEALRQLRLREIQDSVWVAEQMKAMKCYVKTAAQMPKADASALEARYWIVAGVFKVEAHAKRLAKSVEESGFRTQTIPYGSNKMVLIAPNDSLKGVVEDCKKYLASSKEVSGVWIFDTK